MSCNSVFGILGGDRRQAYLARSIAADGYPTYISCLENCPEAQDLPALEPQKLAAACSVILLPLPVTRDGVRLNAPFSQNEILLDDGFAALFGGKTVYGGMVRKLPLTSQLWNHAALWDYYDREELLAGNAFLTAEAAIGLAIQTSPEALGGSRCLVTGFGRIGKALCLALRGLGAAVDCCARKPRDLAAIRALGCRPLQYREIGGGYSVIFNTVPAQVLGAPILSRQRKDVLVLELASRPGGVDLDAAQRLGLHVLDAPSLPGKASPRTAGELIKETVYNMMEEA